MEQTSEGLPKALQKALDSGKPKMVEIHHIEVLEEMQPRMIRKRGYLTPQTRETIKRYANQMKEMGVKSFPPILVTHLGGDRFTLVDGWHRLEAATRINEKKIEVIAKPMTLEEAMWAAFQANSTHGLPMVTQDYREAFKRYIAAGANRNPDGSYRSYREMTADLGGVKSRQTIYNWTQKVFPELAKALSRDPDAHGEEDEAVKDELIDWVQQSIEEAIYANHKALVEALERLRRYNGELGHSVFISTISNLCETFGTGPEGFFDAWRKEEERKERERELEDF